MLITLTLCIYSPNNPVGDAPGALNRHSFWRSQRHISRQSRHTSGAARLMHTYKQTYTHIRTHIHAHTSTHRNTHTRTYKHKHTAIHKNGKEGRINWHLWVRIHCGRWVQINWDDGYEKIGGNGYE